MTEPHTVEVTPEAICQQCDPPGCGMECRGGPCATCGGTGKARLASTPPLPATEMVEAGAKAMCNAAWASVGENWSLASEEQRDEFRLMFRASIPIVIAAERERCAQVMENLCFFTPVDELLDMTKQQMSVRTCEEGAKAIRSLPLAPEG